MAEIDWDARARALLGDYSSGDLWRVAAALREAHAEGERAEREAIMAWASGRRERSAQGRRDAQNRDDLLAFHEYLSEECVYREIAEWVSSRGKEPGA